MHPLVQRVGRGGAAALPLSVLLILLSAGLSLLLVGLWTTRKVAALSPAKRSTAVSDQLSRCEYILVPGKRLQAGEIDAEYRSRLSTVAQLWRDTRVPVYISGADCDGSGISEASAGAQLLQQLGVDPQYIRLEEKASHSYENFAFLSEQLGDFNRGAIVSNLYHLPRLCLIAADFGLVVTPVPALPDTPEQTTSCLRWLQEAFYIHWFLVARSCRGLFV